MLMVTSLPFLAGGMQTKVQDLVGIRPGCLMPDSVPTAKGISLPFSDATGEKRGLLRTALNKVKAFSFWCYQVAV